MLKIENLSVYYGQALALENIDITVPEKGLTAIIGPNGAGKTSVLKLITGEYIPEQGGSVTRARNITVGYLPQDPEFHSSESAYQTALQALPRVADIQAELEQIEASLSEAVVYENPKSLARALRNKPAY